MILILSKILMKLAKELNLNFLSYHSRPSIASSQFGNCLIFHKMLYIICSPLLFNLIIVALQCSVYTILDNTSSCFCSLQSTLRDSTSLPDNSIPSVCSSFQVLRAHNDLFKSLGAKNLKFCADMA